MRGSNTVNPRGSNTSSNSGGGGVSNYTDLTDRPNKLIDETTVPATSTGGEFVPNSDNTNKSSVSITNGGSTITTTRTNEAWGGSGTFSTEMISGDGYISFKINQSNKSFMVGLSRTSDASSTHYNTIDYAIYIDNGTIEIYENGGSKGRNITTFDTNAIYKVNRTGNTITYLKNDIVFKTSATTSNFDLHLDTAFLSVGSVVIDIKMLNAPLVETPESTKYTLDLKNENVIGYHIDELVSDTDFADIDAALADDAVKKAIAGDFVMIASKIYHVIKTNPTLAAHLRLNDETIDEATDAEIEAGTSTDYKLFTAKQIVEKGSVWKYIRSFPNLFTITDEPASVNPTFVNTGGVRITRDGTDIESTTTGWGNAGAWDEVNTIAADGAISFIVTSSPQNSEQMLGLSYKNSETDATSLTFSLIDYAWYFRYADDKAYVRIRNNDGLSNHNATDYTALTFDALSTFGISRVGNKINYIRNGVIVYTVNNVATGNLHLDAAFQRSGSAFSQIQIQRNLVNVHETKISYNSPDLTDKPPASTSTEITEGIITDARVYSPSVIKAGIDSLIGDIPPQSFLDLTNKPDILQPSTIIRQWAQTATSPSSYSPPSGINAADQAAGAPNSPIALGENQVDRANSWAEASGDQGKINELTLTYGTSVNITEVIVRETLNAGTISKLEVLKSGTFETVYTKSGSTETGGTMTGVNPGKVSDTSIKLTNILNYKSNQIRISVGEVGVNEYNEIDAVELIGKVSDRNYVIDYNSELLLNKPPTSISTDITTGTITDARVYSPSVIKTAVESLISDAPSINPSGIVQDVIKSYSDELNLAMAGATAYNITGLDVAITPKIATSKFVINFDIKATAPIGHIFSFSIYIGDTKVNQGTSTLHNVDAVVPVPTTSGGISVLNSVMGSVETSHQPLLQSMTVKVKAWYHKDSSATDDTSTLTLNRAKSNISGLTYKMQGTSMLRVQEIEV